MHESTSRMYAMWCKTEERKKWLQCCTLGQEMTWQDMRGSAQVRSTLVRETTKDTLQVFMTSPAVLRLVDVIVKQYSHPTLKQSMIWKYWGKSDRYYSTTGSRYNSRTFSTATAAIIEIVSDFFLDVQSFSSFPINRRFEKACDKNFPTWVRVQLLSKCTDYQNRSENFICFLWALKGCREGTFWNNLVTCHHLFFDPSESKRRSRRRLPSSSRACLK